MRAIICSVGLWTLAFAAGAGAFFQAAPRPLNLHEKEALRGGDNTNPYRGKCCQPIPTCQNLPSYKSCGQYGNRDCLRNQVQEYNYNGNNMSCTGSSGNDDVICNLGATADCIVVSDCFWNINTNECESRNNWSGEAPGYGSCDPNC